MYEELNPLFKEAERVFGNESSAVIDFNVGMQHYYLIGRRNGVFEHRFVDAAFGYTEGEEFMNSYTKRFPVCQVNMYVTPWEAYYV